MSDTLPRFATVRTSDLPGTERARVLIVFLDFTNFDRMTDRVSDTEVAATMDSHYSRVAHAVRAAGGRVIKFIGDATLATFPDRGIDAGVRAVMHLRESEDRVMKDKGWDCRLHAKAHVGEVVAGNFGPADDRRYDVFGKAVNAAAKLKTTGFTLSSDAYDGLSAEMQRHFKRDPDTGNYRSD